MFLTEMLPRDLKRAVDEKWPLLVPMGSVEFHGNHLPLGTDSFITEAVACGVEKRLDVVVAPTVHLCPTGYAVSGPEQGTTDIGVELFIRWCRELVGNYRRMGFGRILFLVHHQGGNIGAFLRAAVTDELMYGTYREQGYGWWSDQQKKAACPQGFIEICPAMLDTHFFGGHAGRGETEAILAARLELVHAELTEKDDFWWNADADEADVTRAVEQLQAVIDRWVEKLTAEH